MTEREKVIYSIERCICRVPDACRDCAYDAEHPYPECEYTLLQDALELLKEQEPVDPAIGGNQNSCWYFICPRCQLAIDKGDQYCRHCGRAVKWE